MKRYEIPSKYTPKPDQERSIREILRKIEAGDTRIMFLGATGSGKTVISAEIKRRLFEFPYTVTKGEDRLPRIMFVVHRDNLISNTLDTVVDSGIHKGHVGIVAGRYRENRNASIQIVTIQTAGGSRDLSWFQPDIIIFDEAHITAFSEWGKGIHQTHRDVPILNLTATPWREKKTEAFTQLVPSSNWVLAPLPYELMQMGRLVPRCRYFKEIAIDTSGVKLLGGDFAKKELSVASRDEAVVKAGLAFWDKNAPGESVGVFCVDVKHANFVAKLAREWGRKVAVVTAKTLLLKTKTILNGGQESGSTESLSFVEKSICLSPLIASLRASTLNLSAVDGG